MAALVYEDVLSVSKNTQNISFDEYISQTLILKIKYYYFCCIEAAFDSHSGAC